jgi:predicted ArsR family transcriptional regulator
MSAPEVDGQLDSLGILAEPLRRSLYRYVVGQGRPVPRAEVADALGIPRSVAAFHLDRLAQAGLLEVTRAHTSARRGPGSGRPAKLYRRSPAVLDVSLPQRAYLRLSTLLADAVAAGGAEDALNDDAARVGRRMGEAARPRGPLPDGAAELEAAAVALSEWGYEPYAQAGRLRMRNCPYRAVQENHPPLVCDANLHLLEGACAGLGVAGLEARMDPRPGECCVTVSLKTA